MPRTIRTRRAPAAVAPVAPAVDAVEPAPVVTVEPATPAPVDAVEPAAPVDASAPVEPATGAPAEPATVDADVRADTVETYGRALARDANNIARNATNFDKTSVRDDAYLMLLGRAYRLANVQPDASVTLRDIHDAGIKRAGESDKRRYNPFYSGSGKATDVGAFNRLRKAGSVRISDDGNTITVTERGSKLAAFTRQFNAAE